LRFGDIVNRSERFSDRDIEGAADIPSPVTSAINDHFYCVRGIRSIPRLTLPFWRRISMLIPQIIAGLLIGAGIGFFIGHIWTRRRTVETWMRDRERLESKVRSCDRDLDRTRGELKSFREQTAKLKHELTTAGSKLNARDEEFGALEARLKSF